MVRERYVLLGLAQVRSAWLREASRWSTSGSLPIELVKTLAIEEIRAHLRSGRALSAVLVDDTVPGLDRDLMDEARAAGCAVIVVDSGRSGRRWTDLGAVATLPPELDEQTLLQVLTQVAQPVGRGGDDPSPVLGPTGPAAAGGVQGAMVAVTGAGGTGRSVVAMALAQAGTGREPGGSCLADLALHAEQAMLHGTPDVVPGLLELVEAHRLGALAPDSVRALTWHIPTRGYDLLLGLRRHRDWASLRPRAVAAALEGMRRTYALTVIDVDADVEGERQTGSIEVEERNVLARVALREADLVVVVGGPDMKGLHALLRVVRDLIDHEVEPDRLLPVINRAPRGPRARAELTRAFGALLTADHRTAARGGRADEVRQVCSPVFLVERRNLEPIMRDAARLPDAWLRPVTSAAEQLSRSRDLDGRGAIDGDPVLVAPGSLGQWTIDAKDQT